MRRFSSQYIFTNTGKPLKRAIITTDDTGTVLSIEENNGSLPDQHSVEYYNGVIVPGFVNCHCHLELSHLKGVFAKGTGLPSFLNSIRNQRTAELKEIQSAAAISDNDMYREGVSLCADICNTSDTFKIKTESKIEYLSLLEVFGIDPERAALRINEICNVAEKAAEYGLPFYFVPHAPYSLSVNLFRMLKEKSKANKVTSIHFMETEDEKDFLAKRQGPMMDFYMESGLLLNGFETVTSHTDAILNQITESGNLILVHNTFADREIINRLAERKNKYWCICPNSNLYIENQIPPVMLFTEQNCTIVIGTDSLSSNTRLSIIEELKTLQGRFCDLTLNQLIEWATINGAKALGKDEHYGSIREGIRPGLVLIENLDLVNMKLLPESFSTRLI